MIVHPGDTVDFANLSMDPITAYIASKPPGAIGFSSVLCDTNNYVYQYKPTVPGVYEFVCSAGAWSQSGSFTVADNSAVINANIAPDLVCYPLPATNKLRIESGRHDHSQTDVSLFDLTGMKVADFHKIRNGEIDVSNIASGNYILHVRNDSFSKTMTITVRR